MRRLPMEFIYVWGGHALKMKAIKNSAIGGQSYISYFVDRYRIKVVFGLLVSGTEKQILENHFKGEAHERNIY